MTYVDVLPKVGETVFGTSFLKSFGGKGANQAVQCARLGIKVGMAGVVGQDSYGSEYLAQLGAEGVDTSAMRRSDVVNTGTASIQVDQHGQNSIIIVQGANLDFLSEHVVRLEEVIKTSNVVVCQNEIPQETTLATLQLCKTHGTVSIFNPAPASIDVLPLLPLCDIVCPNETELATLTGLPTNTDEEVQIAAGQLLDMGCRVVLVTLGARGASLNRTGESRIFPADQVKAIDTVGAGDSFIGMSSLRVNPAVIMIDLN